ncbi:hypothetical protein CRD59_00835 [Bifidobacterium xylocopae]|uniref:Uncharacterized protein n=1 Tax=Bifidobacterium xylocopae TaxID=2493119 RepID=A0A366KEP1_9BIFI|nr:hypothetical protein CRD59_00835 [Bifidobacterium xylocopae]
MVCRARGRGGCAGGLLGGCVAALAACWAAVWLLAGLVHGVVSVLHLLVLLAAVPSAGRALNGLEDVPCGF